MEKIKQEAFWPSTCLIIMLFGCFAYGSITLVKQADAQTTQRQQRILTPAKADKAVSGQILSEQEKVLEKKYGIPLAPRAFTSNETAPKENCEQYYQESIRQANAARDAERRWVDGTVGIKEGITSLSYSAIYQNCVARSKR